MGLVDFMSPSEPFDTRLDELDDDDSPSVGRSAVQYGGDDALFEDSPAPMVAASSSGQEDGADALAGLALGGGADSGALIAYLEQMAASFEEQTGEVETEIRGKIAQLRAVLDARPAVVAEQVARMQRDDAADGPAGDAEMDAAEAVCDESLLAIEENIGRVDAMLRDDPDARQMLASTAHVWAPTVTPDATGS